MHKQIVVIVAVLLNACTNYDWQWPSGTGLRIEIVGNAEIHTADGTPPQTWSALVEQAVNNWTAALGNCPFPFEIVEKGGKPIRLVVPDLWRHGEPTGMATEDYIEVLSHRRDTWILAITTHEIGHALGLAHEPEGSDSIMVGNVVERTTPSTEDGHRAREELWCVN